MVPPSPLRSIRDLDRTSPQFHRQLSTLLHGDEYQIVISSLQSEDLAWLVEYLDSVLTSSSNPASLESKGVLHGLRRICGTKEVLPKSCILPESLLDIRPPPASGDALDDPRLQVEYTRIQPNDDLQKVKETFYQVAVVWKRFDHQKIVPLLGVTIDPLQFVSNRMPGGNLTEYVTNHPGVDRPSLLADVAEGLNYLHSYDIIHGDLKASHVLVDATGHARITDFGLAVVTRGPCLTRSAPTRGDHRHGPQWIAPEILDDSAMCSKEADVFSFAGVTIEVFTGAVPFSDELPRTASLAIKSGQRPPRPADPDLTDCLWALIQQCWDQEAHLRPHALQISRGFGVPAWRHLVDCPLALDERISLTKAIFSNREETEAVKNLHGNDAQSFVNILDEMLDRLDLELRIQCLKTLCKMCGREALLPRSVQIPLCYDRMGTPLYHSGHSDVWQGKHQERKVAVKVLTVCVTSNLDKITRRFCREVVTWRVLCHQNVLPLLGVTMTRNQFAMVSEWMDNGNINEFVKAHRDVNRFNLLADVTRGLIYMHGEGMIHGDLKGANILIDQHHHACLADFGLSTIVPNPAYPTSSSTYTEAGTTRWMSPELLDPDRLGLEDSRRTKESDCYALGMVIYEVLSGQVPFGRLHNDFIAMLKTTEGERPERPEGSERVWFTDALWKTLELCWSHKPEVRPTIEDVSECLEQTTWQPLPPREDCGIESSVDGSYFTISSSVLETRILPSPQLLVVPTLVGSLTRGCDTPAEGEPVSGESVQCMNMTLSHQALRFTKQIVYGLDTEQRNRRGVGMPTIPVPSVQYIDEGTDGGSGTVYQEIQPPEMLAPVTPGPISASISLMKVVNWDGISQGIVPALVAAFEAHDYPDCVKNLHARGIDLEWYIDSLDRVIDRLSTNLDIRKRCIRALSETCGFYEILPRSHAFARRLSKPGLQPFASSTTFDIWRLTDETNQEQVFAAKSLRVRDGDVVKEIKQKYYKEVIVSKRMNHPNILSIEGVAPELFGFNVVSRWMEHGNILEYIREHPGIDRLNLLIGVTCGLDYLHSNEIAHGDLKSPNILIDAEGNPCINDFTNCWFTKCTGLIGALTPSYDRTMRWTAPERLAQEREPTTMSDVYSLSMVIVELVTGKMPFPESTDPNVFVMVLKGERPPKPRHFDAPGVTSAVWEIAQKCWHEEPKERPEANVVLRSLESLVNPDGRQTRLSQRLRQIFGG